MVYIMTSARRPYTNLFLLLVLLYFYPQSIDNCLSARVVRNDADAIQSITIVIPYSNVGPSGENLQKIP